MSLRVGVVTCSDRTFAGESTDTSGPAIEEFLRTKLDTDVLVMRRVVPDDHEQIQNAVLGFCDTEKCSLIITTGGTGFSERDVTPEAIRPLLWKEAPGLVHAMMSFGLTQTPYAWLGRPVAGVRGKTVIITVPGSKKAAIEGLTPLVDNGLLHAINLASGQKFDPHPVHPQEKGSDQSAAPQMTSDIPSSSCGCGAKSRHTDPAPAPTGTGPASRPRQSTFPMTPMGEALEIIRKVSEAFPKRTVEVPAVESCGRVLASDVTSAFNHPPFRASIKDGYAVVSSDGVGDFPCIAALVAGDIGNFTLKAGSLCRVNTGGPIPDGADAVVQVEDTEVAETTGDEANEEKVVRILKAAVPKQDIRPIGCDLATGGTALKSGHTMRAADVGLALSCGRTTLDIVDAPRVAVVSTGDELADCEALGPNSVPPTGKIFDSNRAMLMAALLDTAPRLNPIDGGIAADNMPDTRRVFSAALAKADIIITSGGVSMGEADCAKRILPELGADVKFGRVNMKPGKPTTFATLTFEGRQKLVFALPGNPVSAMVCFHLFVAPALRVISGLPFNPSTVRAKLEHDVRLDPERPEYHRCRLTNKGEAGYTATSTGIQASHRLLSLSGANGLMVLPAAEGDSRTVAAGKTVEVIVLTELPAAN